MREPGLEVDANGSLTARGRKASQYLSEIRQVLVGGLRLGDNIRQTVTDGSAAYFRVMWLVNKGEYMEITCTNAKYKTMVLRMPHFAKVRIGWSAEVKARQLQMAVDYQATLNIWGKPQRKGVEHAEQVTEQHAS